MFVSELGSPKDLVTSDVTDTSFAASWTAALGNVKMYKIRWKSMYSDESGEKMVPGDITDTMLEGLTPETLYQVSVLASYDRGDGSPLTGQETTDGTTVYYTSFSVRNVIHRITQNDKRNLITSLLSQHLPRQFMVKTD